jgi:hypothetical protein
VHHTISNHHLVWHDLENEIDHEDNGNRCQDYGGNETHDHHSSEGLGVVGNLAWCGHIVIRHINSSISGEAN